MSKTFQAKPNEVPREWVVVDLDGVTLGRAATAIARMLRGKNKPQFTPHVDTGDFVVVVNAAKVHLTGRKEDQKVYYKHTGYVGHLRSRTAGEVRVRKPADLIFHAVWGMLPKGPLGRKLLKKLKVYPGAEHPHEAQMPKAVEVQA